ncbi:MAG: 4Fe-4S binding protein [Rikenellaceae bacterium]|nr:4Fe-4S binding protein [Rikenellaceae bacterium]
MAIPEINKSLCDGCGACVESCRKRALSLTDTPAAERLLQENRALSEQLRIWTQTARAVLENLPLAVLVADKEGRISVINRPFIDCLDYETQESGPLTGSRIEQIFDDEVVTRFYDTLHTGKPFDDLIVTSGTGRRHGSVIPLVGGDSAMITLREPYGGALRDDIALRIESVIDQNMAMVQKIGYLLGEEMSQSTEKLNSIIRQIEETATDR